MSPFVVIAVLVAGFFGLSGKKKDTEAKKDSAKFEPLTLGSSGETARAWQKLLCGYFEVNWGKYRLDPNGIPELRGSYDAEGVDFIPTPINWADGRFGPLTADLTTAFQRSANETLDMPVRLRTDGIVDRDSYIAMYAFFENGYDPRKRRWVDVATSSETCDNPVGVESDLKQQKINDRIIEEKGIFNPGFGKSL